ncbi:S5A-REDUCTASE domain-containing protein [Fusarium sp. LHS14.1]|nr:S5A-REDUCTASE domain-containing protein [Fusarium sp. LHS14.1]
MAKELRDNVSRVKRINWFGTTIFVGLRAADAFLQYAFLRRRWASDLVRVVGGTSLAANLIVDGSMHLRPYYNLIAAMAFGSSLKQITHIFLVLEQEMFPSSAVTVGPLQHHAGNLTSPLLLSAVGFYLIGLLTEAVSEIQRTAFKRDPANKGKPYAGGLFSLARHVNYGGYTIWRSAYALASGGWAWGIAVFAFFFYDFAARGVPVLDAYLSGRYKEQWKAIKARVPYRLIPGIY